MVKIPEIKCPNPECSEVFRDVPVKPGQKSIGFKCMGCGSVVHYKLEGETLVNLNVPNDLPPRQKPEPPKAEQPKPPKTEPGWLIVHDELTEYQSFPLRLGLNFVGRLAATTPPEVSIRIQTKDMFMSRKHCQILVKQRSPESPFEYLISDETSKNHTFVNGGKTKLAPGDELYLSDNETIQIGHTKLVLRTLEKAKSREEAENAVRNRAYDKTIVINQ